MTSNRRYPLVDWINTPIDNEVNKFINSIVNFKSKQRTNSQFYLDLYKHFHKGEPSRERLPVKTFIPIDKVGSKTALEWFNIYSQKLSDLYETRRDSRRRLPEDDIIAYPFKSKQLKFFQKHPEVKSEVRPTDKRLDKKAFQRPSFSKYHDTWEIDY
jgi:hypothetical protein